MAQAGEFFDELERMSPEERERYYDERLRQIVRYGYEHAPAVREKLDRVGVKPSQINTVKDLENKF